MKHHPLALCALLGLSTITALAQVDSRVTAKFAEPLGAAAANTTAHFNVYLPLTNSDVLEKLLRDQTDSTSLSYHKWLTPAQFKAQFGPSPADMAKAKTALKSAGFTIVEEKTSSLKVEGPVWAVESTFKAHLQEVRTARGQVKLAAAERHLTMPETLASLGAVVPEFTTHLAAHVHSAKGPQISDAKSTTRLSSVDSFYYADDMREAYEMPSFTAEVTPFLHLAVPLTGAGSTIGIVISSVISPADLAASFNSTIHGGTAVDVQAYSAHTSVPVPTVTIDPVDGGSGPFNGNSDDAAEASLDTQMSLGTAPGAKEILYDMPDLTDASIMDAYTQVDEENRVDVVSSSFGECELDFTAAANGGVDYTGILRAFHSLFQQGNAQGITFVASSGDNGAVPCTSVAFDNNPTNGTNFVAGVENPASDPSVTSVGGTNLQTKATPTPDDAVYLSENANYDPRVPAEFEISPSDIVSVGNNTWGSGGGFSIIFSKPVYQLLAKTGSSKFRSVPDLSLMMGGCPGDADLNAQNCEVLPRSAVIVWIGGGPSLLIGTSSSSPQFAGVVALAVEEYGGRLGNVNPLIYSLGALQTLLGGSHAPSSFQYFHRNISGNNNLFTVTPGQSYSEVLGNGTLDVKNFLLLPKIAASGAPNTASNP